RGEVEVWFHLVPFGNAGADRLGAAVRPFKVHLQLDLASSIERQRLPGNLGRLYHETVRIHNVLLFLRSVSPPRRTTQNPGLLKRLTPSLTWQSRVSPLSADAPKFVALLPADKA